MLSDRDLELIQNAKEPVSDTLENRRIYTQFFENFMREVRPYSLQKNDSYHGFYSHTKQVGLFALDYALSLKENPVPVLIASAFHDCARLDDSYNETHALQAVPIARQFLSSLPLDKEISEKIMQSVAQHTTGKKAKNYIEACLWDADRTRLSWEREYDPRFFNTEKGNQIASLYYDDQQNYIQKQNDFLKEHRLFQKTPIFNVGENVSFYYPSSERNPMHLYSHPSAVYTILEENSIPLTEIQFKKEDITYPRFSFKKSPSWFLANIIRRNGPLLAKNPLEKPLNYSGIFDAGQITGIEWNDDKKNLSLRISGNGETKIISYPPQNDFLLGMSDGLTKALEKHLLDISPEYRKAYHQEMIDYIETGIAFQINYNQPQPERLLELYKKHHGKER